MRDEYFSRVPDIIKEYHDFVPLDREDEISQFDQFLEYFVKLSCLLEIIENEEAPALPDDEYSAIEFIKSYFARKAEELEANKISRRYAELRHLAAVRYTEEISQVFAYEFSDGDLREIQNRINELRSLISQSELFDEPFRQRLLKKLETLQRELHKRMSDLDRFWGLLGDAGIAVGRFGCDAKPFFDRVRELLEVVWKTQARAEELPSRTPLPELEPPDQA